MAREMYRDVTHMETVKIPDKFFDKTFIRYLMLGTEEARRENEQYMPYTKTSRNSASKVIDTAVTEILTHTE